MSRSSEAGIASSKLQPTALPTSVLDYFDVGVAEKAARVRTSRNAGNLDRHEQAVYWTEYGVGMCT